MSIWNYTQFVWHNTLIIRFSFIEYDANEYVALHSICVTQHFNNSFFRFILNGQKEIKITSNFDTIVRLAFYAILTLKIKLQLHYNMSIKYDANEHMSYSIFVRQHSNNSFFFYWVWCKWVYGITLNLCDTAL